jgi:hypothetical protein
MPSRGPSSFHFKESNDKRDQIVTGVYQLNVRTGELRYGGSLFKQRSLALIKKELALEQTGTPMHEKLLAELKAHKNWNRRKHIQLALKRLTETPVIINFSPIPFEQKPSFPQYRRLENFIRDVCMHRLGMYYHGERPQLAGDKLLYHKSRIFDPKLTQAEKQAEEWYESVDSDSDSDDVADEEKTPTFECDFILGIFLGFMCYFALLTVLQLLPVPHQSLLISLNTLHT